MTSNCKTSSERVSSKAHSAWFCSSLSTLWHRTICIFAIVVVWYCLSGSPLVPTPLRTARMLVTLLASLQTWQDLGVTLLRGLCGLAFATAVAYVTAIPCGLRRSLQEYASPLVALLQGCPPIVWISLLMVWLSLGSAVPVTVVFVSTFPPMFINLQQATASLDGGLLEMARFYRVPRRRVLRQLILPGIQNASRASIAFAAGITWKVTATAEYLSAENGIGARLHIAFQNLELPELFAWTIILAALGLGLETLIRTINTSSITQAHNYAQG